MSMDITTALNLLVSARFPTTINTIADVTAQVVALPLMMVSTPCTRVYIKAGTANAGNVRIGDANIGAARGFELDAGQEIILDVPNLALIWCIGNGADTISVTYVA